MPCYLNGILFLTLLVGSLASEELVNPIPHIDCPKVDDFNHPVLMPYLQDCTKYYSCLNGLAFPQKCPNNLHWSATTYRCDYPEIAKCQVYIQPTSPKPPPVIPTKSPMIEIFYEPYPNDCNKYYQCQMQACPPNYHWNSYEQRCDFPHLAHCPYVQIAPPTTPKIPTAPTVPATVKPTTTTIVIPTAPTAPATLPTESNTNIPPVSCPECKRLCEGTDHMYLPFEKDCHKFIQCNGWEYIQTCPDNLLWNDKLKTCDRFCIRV